LPNETDAATYENLLSLNLLGIKTLGCILGFDKQKAAWRAMQRRATQSGGKIRDVFPSIQPD
jgi:hypothetical protein